MSEIVRPHFYAVYEGDDESQPIYVGESKNVKSRIVGELLNKNRKHSLKHKLIYNPNFKRFDTINDYLAYVKEHWKLRFIYTEFEVDAVLLEGVLKKMFNSKYNKEFHE
jgi:excinuclease UvrABC nuclease subunit